MGEPSASASASAWAWAIGQWAIGQWAIGQWTIGQWTIGQWTIGQWTGGVFYSRKKVGGKNYSRREVMEQLLYTLKAILPVGPKDWAQVGQIHNDNFPDTNRSDVKLAKRVKYLIKCKEGVGDGQEPYGMEEGYQTNTEDEEYIASSCEEQEQEQDDNFDDDNIPPIPPLGQPSQTMTQQSTTQQSTEPTQPTRHQRSPNTSTTNNSTNGRQEILDFLRENSEREREQRIEYQRLEREQRIEYQQLEREQREAALESLKAAIVDVATIFLNGLRPNSNPNSNSNSNPPSPAIPTTPTRFPPRPAPLKSLVVPV
eukprot:jgi/Psemu1/38895/gm1.38895_g